MSRLEWLNAGFTLFMAEALEDLGLSYEQVLVADPMRTLQTILEWHGIIGYTDSIMAAAEVLGWEAPQ